ncbi:MAG: hypothetical protein JWQ49_155 [Edaphobacter sp.]|jgi:hypothetical protein|nr:hypothetical protein [Edaphobacter sp.]
MRIRPSISALSLLLVFSTISGCKKVRTFELSPGLTPIIHAREGDVLRWRSTADRDSVTITPDEGLCKETGPFRPSRNQTVQCTIAKQKDRSAEETLHTYTIVSPQGPSDPSVKYYVVVRPCKGFC